MICCSVGDLGQRRLGSASRTGARRRTCRPRNISTSSGGDLLELRGSRSWATSSVELRLDRVQDRRGGSPRRPLAADQVELDRPCYFQLARLGKSRARVGGIENAGRGPCRWWRRPARWRWSSQTARAAAWAQSPGPATFVARLFNDRRQPRGIGPRGLGRRLCAARQGRREPSHLALVISGST